MIVRGPLDRISRAFPISCPDEGRSDFGIGGVARHRPRIPDLPQDGIIPGIPERNLFGRPPASRRSQDIPHHRDEIVEDLDVDGVDVRCNRLSRILSGDKVPEKHGMTPRSPIRVEADFAADIPLEEIHVSMRAMRAELI